MDLTSTKIIKELLVKYHLKPSKGLGQNFLVHAGTLEKIVEAADVNENDVILEIGPGLGTLTRALATKAQKVIAIEKDRGMVEILKETVGSFKNVDIINGDILKIKSQTPMTNDQSMTNPQLPENYKLVANLPYYITSPIIRMFLETENPPSEMVLMVQKEVAQRICAKPPEMSILAVSVQFYATAKIVSTVSRGCFWPAPNVDSAIIKITPNKNRSPASVKTFFEVVKAGFSQPRKQLGNNFCTALGIGKEEMAAWLQKNNIKPAQRAETLTVQDWVNLTTSV